MRASQSAIALLLFLASLTVGRPASGQTPADGEPIPCLFEWRGDFTTSQVIQFASQFDEACSDARAIAWDEKIAEAQRWRSLLESDAESVADRIVDWRKALSMLEKEKQHLADEIKRLGRPGTPPSGSPRAGTPPSGSPRDGKSPTATGAPPASARGAVRFTLGPGEKPWVPDYLKDALKGNPGFSSFVSSVKGAARLRRDNVETPVQAGTPVALLRAGDVLATGADGEVFIQLNDGSKLSMGTSTEIMWSTTQACLGSFSGYPMLIKGVLMWSEGGNRLRSCPKTAETRYETVALRGAAFTLKYGESNGRGVTTIAVQDGTVRVNDRFGEETTISAGAPRTFEHSIESPLATDPVVRAIVEGRLLKQGDRVFMPVGTAGIWIDETRWMINAADPAMPDYRTFESLDGEVEGAFFYDPNVLDRNALRDVALAAARKASPEGRIVKEEWRKVGALSVLYLENEIAEAGSTDLITAEYFTAAQGTVTLIIQVSKDQLAAHSAEVSAVLNSLISVDPFSLRAK